MNFKGLMAGLMASLAEWVCADQPRAAGEWDSLFANEALARAPLRVNQFHQHTDGTLYAATGFPWHRGQQAHGLLIWRDGHWEAFSPKLEFASLQEGGLLALASEGPDLFVGGQGLLSTNVPGLRGVARWDGVSWQPLGGGVSGMVRALVAGPGWVIAGGDFTEAGGVACTNVALWRDGRWSGFEPAIPESVQQLVRWGTNVLARSMGTLWQLEGAGWRPWLTGGPFWELAVGDGQLFLGGQFDRVGGVSATNIAVFRPGGWEALGAGLGGTNSWVHSLGYSAGRLLATGTFTHSGTESVAGLAAWDGQKWTGLLEYPLLTPGALLVRGDEMHVAGRHQAGVLGSSSSPAHFDGRNWVIHENAGISWFMEPTGLAATTDGIALALDDQGDPWVGSIYRLRPGLLVWKESGWVHSGLDPSEQGFRFSSGGWLAAEGSRLVAGVYTWQSRLTEHPAARPPAGTPLWSDLPLREPLLVSGGRIYGRDEHGLVEWQAGVLGRVSADQPPGQPTAAVASGERLVVAFGTEYGDYHYVRSSVREWDGSAWHTLAEQLDGQVNVLLLDEAGLLAGGSFSTVDLQPLAALVRWDGIRWNSVAAPSSPFAGEVKGLARDSRGRLHVAGRFTLTGMSNLVRWDGQRWEAIRHTLPTHPERLAWWRGGLFMAGRIGESRFSSWRPDDCPFEVQAEGPATVEPGGMMQVRVVATRLTSHPAGPVTVNLPLPSGFEPVAVTGGGFLHESSVRWEWPELVHSTNVLVTLLAAGSPQHAAFAGVVLDHPAAGRFSAPAFTVDVVGGGAAPTVSVLVLTNEPVFRAKRYERAGPTQLRAALGEADSPADTVEFFADGLMIGKATAQPWETTYDAPPDRTVTFWARVTDQAGRQRVSPAVAQEFVPVPENDEFANRRPLAGTNLTISGTTRWSLRQTNEIERSVWWEWTAAQRGNAYVSAPAEPAVSMKVWRVEDSGSLELLQAIPWFCPRPDCGRSLTFAVRVDVGDRLVVSATTGELFPSGSGEVNGTEFVWSLTAFAPPPHDDYGGRQEITGNDFVVSGDLLGASLLPGEPEDGYSGNWVSLWWTWTPDAPGFLYLLPGGELPPGVSFQMFASRASDLLVPVLDRLGQRPVAFGAPVYSGESRHIQVIGPARLSRQPFRLRFQHHPDALWIHRQEVVPTGLRLHAVLVPDPLRRSSLMFSTNLVDWQEYKYLGDYGGTLLEEIPWLKIRRPSFFRLIRR